MQTVDVGFTHVARQSAVWPAALILYPLYRDDRRSPARARLASARKVAWLSDRTRPFALVLVQSDDPADTPLGPFGHLGVACATVRDRREGRSGAAKAFAAGTEQLGDPVGYFAFLFDPDGNTTEAVMGQQVGLEHCGGERQPSSSLHEYFPPPRRRRITLQRIPRQHAGAWRWVIRKTVSGRRGGEDRPLDNKAYEKALRKPMLSW